ncbi:MAG TPA: S8 family peptidase [Terriglobia bacterium]|nr:S8 family peptidase [Terriglobia bacterium]
MQRRLYFTIFCLMFGGSAFAQSGQNRDRASGQSQYADRDRNYNAWDRSGTRDNPKIDNHLNHWVQWDKDNGYKDEKIRVIIQHISPSNANDDDDVVKKGGTTTHKYSNLKMRAVEVTADKVEKLADSKNVKYVSLDERVHSFSGEPRVASGAALATQTYGVTGAGIGVAVIDSGIAAHPDLQNVVKSVDFVDPNGTGRVDGYGHGTHVAGIVAGSGSASGGAYKGVAPGAKLIDLRVLDATGGGYTSDVIDAIEWAVQNRNAKGNDGQSMNIRVINLSLGHRPFESTATDPLAAAARFAVQNGIVVVAAAGNYGKNANGATIYGGITSPANEPAVITVGAMTTWGTDDRSDDTVATYSSRGPTAVEHLLKPDIAAPGSRVVAPVSSSSTLAKNFPQLRVGSSYIKMSGTSMASPVVAGAVALMLQKNPSMTPNTVKAALMFTAEHRAANPIAVGAGYVNIAGAVNLAANINTSVAAGQYRILNNGFGLHYSNIIGGSPVIWGQSIVWHKAMYSGRDIFYNTAAWSGTMIWGSTIVWDVAETIVWDEAMSTTPDIAGFTIVWDETAGLTIVWDEP